MDEMIAEWVRLKVQLARGEGFKTPMERCGVETREPIAIEDPHRTIEAVVVRVCGERYYICPTCSAKLTELELERRRATAKAARLWKKILEVYP